MDGISGRYKPSLRARWPMSIPAATIFAGRWNPRHITEFFEHKKILTTAIRSSELFQPSLREIFLKPACGTMLTATAKCWALTVGHSWMKIRCGWSADGRDCPALLATGGKYFGKHCTAARP